MPAQKPNDTINTDNKSGATKEPRSLLPVMMNDSKQTMSWRHKGRDEVYAVLSINRFGPKTVV